MAELVVIYDPALELAAIINTDERVSWGPAMIGPEAPVILQSFIDTTPFDVSELDTYTAARAFADFLDKLVAARTPAPPDPPAGQVEPSGDPGVAVPDPPGTAQGAPTDQPPAVQPADTDPGVEANPSPASAPIVHVGLPTGAGSPPAPQTVLQQCAVCEGTGTVQMGEGEPAAQCGLCGGSGQVTVTVPA